jgi:hypothetical protein
MEADILAHTDICNQKQIESAWRGSRLYLFNPQRALRTIVREPTPDFQRPKTPAESDIFNQVFLNCSPPDILILKEENTLLTSTIDGRTVPSTPVCQYQVATDYRCFVRVIARLTSASYSSCSPFCNWIFMVVSTVYNIFN